MKITLANIGKRYNTEWIFRKVNYTFEAGNSYAILGSNGSGKSTLLQIIAGNNISSEGTITFEGADDKIISQEEIYRHISFAAPYLELFEEFTLAESLKLHAEFKNFLPGLTQQKIIELTGLEKSADKQLRYYSSGMKQRVKLALALLSDVSLVLLDEPTSNLDKQGVAWYKCLVDEFCKNRLVVVCSNHQKEEYEFCRNELEIGDYKLKSN